MEITGKIIAVLEERKGVAQRTGAEWRCGQYVLETVGEYPRKFFFEVFGSERIEQFAIQQGEMLTVHFDVDAREYNGRWFNSIRAFRVERGTAQQPQMPAGVPPFTAQPAQPAQPVAQQSAQPAAPAQAVPFAAAPVMTTSMDASEELPF